MRSFALTAAGSGIAFDGTHLYMAVGPSSPKEGDIHVIDPANGSLLRIITPTGITIGGGVDGGVAWLGGYLYEVAATAECAGVSVVKVDPDDGRALGCFNIDQLGPDTSREIGTDGVNLFFSPGADHETEPQGAYGSPVYTLSPEGVVLESNTIPASEVNAFAYHNNELYVVTANGIAVYAVPCSVCASQPVLSPTRSLYISPPDPDLNILGLALSSNEVFALNIWSNGARIHVVDPMDGSLLRSFDTPRGYGLEFDGTYLYLAEPGGVIHVIDPIDGSAVRDITVTGVTNIRGGVAWVHGYLYTLAFAVESGLSVIKINPDDGSVVGSFSVYHFGTVHNQLATDGERLLYGGGPVLYTISTDGEFLGLSVLGRTATLALACRNNELYVSDGKQGQLLDPLPPVLVYPFSCDLDENNTPVARAGPDQTVSAGPGCAADVTLDGSASSAPPGSTLTYTWTWTVPSGTATGPNPQVTLPVGVHTITLQVDDGNGGSASDTVIITVEDGPPLITLNGSNPLIHEVGTAFSDPGATAIDGCAGDLGSIPGVSDVNPNKVGPYSITYTATDSKGHSASETRIVQVTDTTPPVIAPPSDQQSEATGPGGATVDYTPPPTSDAGDGPGMASCDPPPGSVFPIGDTTVTCVATDAQGNAGTPTPFVIHVRDTTPPVITLAGLNPMTVECHTAFVDPGATASDLVGGDLTAVIQAVSNVNPNVVGSYTVTYSVMDPSGNTISAIRRIDVVDTTAPVIASLATNPSVLSPPIRKMLPVTVSVSVADLCDATPVCQIVSVSSNQPVTDPGDATSPDWQITGPLTVDLRAEFALGVARVYTITVECRDASGNSSRQKVSVSVPLRQR